MLAGLFGGIPGAGSTKGTVVNINAGGRTRLSGTIHGLFLLTVLLGLGSLAAHIPLAVLAGLLIPIGLKIIDFRGLRQLGRVPRADAAVLVIVLLVTTFGSLITAVGVGVALAALLFMKKAADLGEQGLELRPVSEFAGEAPWQDELEFYEAFKNRVIIKHLDGPFFFGFTSYFKDRAAEVAGRRASGNLPNGPCAVHRPVGSVCARGGDSRPRASRDRGGAGMSPGAAGGSVAAHRHHPGSGGRGAGVWEYC